MTKHTPPESYGDDVDDVVTVVVVVVNLRVDDDAADDATGSGACDGVADASRFGKRADALVDRGACGRVGCAPWMAGSELPAAPVVPHAGVGGASIGCAMMGTIGFGGSDCTTTGSSPLDKVGAADTAGVASSLTAAAVALFASLAALAVFIARANKKRAPTASSAITTDTAIIMR